MIVGGFFLYCFVFFLKKIFFFYSSLERKPTNLRTYESIYEPTFVPTDVPTDVTFVPPYANQEFNKRERNKREGKYLD